MSISIMQKEKLKKKFLNRLKNCIKLGNLTTFTKKRNHLRNDTHKSRRNITYLLTHCV